MRSLSCFRLKPFIPSENITEFICSVDRVGGFFVVNYKMEGKLSNLSLRSSCGQLRFTHELWKGTVFELFLKSEDSKSYYEWNFCPSNRFAAYKFDSYRHPEPPTINKSTKIEYQFFDVTDTELRFELRFSLPEELKDVDDFKIQLSAIIKDRSSPELEYFALQHPTDKPDFHNEDCFQFILNTRG